ETERGATRSGAGGTTLAGFARATEAMTGFSDWTNYANLPMDFPPRSCVESCPFDRKILALPPAGPMRFGVCAPGVGAAWCGELPDILHVRFPAPASHNRRAGFVSSNLSGCG